MRSRLYEVDLETRRGVFLQEKKVGSGDRSERIRTYNFPQGGFRHRMLVYKLDQFLTGEALDEMIAALSASEQAEKLSQLNVK